MAIAVSINTETDPFGIYRQTLDRGMVSYSAGFPHYPRNFSRDTIKAGIIASSAELLASQLEISARYQGEKHNPKTGEKPGRIHHEFPGVPMHNMESYSTYNACDTTSLFLIAAEGLRHIDKPTSIDFMRRRKENLKRAVDHVLDCVDEDDLFWEKPPDHGKGYALKVTYWKDSILPNANGQIEPVYPVIFSQAQFIAARGLLSASRILDDSFLADRSDRMYRAGIQEFMRPSGYIVYRDGKGELLQISSDELHALAYIPRTYKDLLPLDAIRRRAKELSTPFGFMCTPRDIAEQLSDKYHGNAVWIFEQAMIHYGATKFELKEEAQTAASVAKYIGEGQEFLGVDLDEQGDMIPVPKGNDRQLWSKAASEYFIQRSTLLTNQWL
jgi:hypothetical protein